MLAIADEGMEGSVGVAEVRALPVGTSEARGVHPLGGSSAAFDLTPGTRLPLAQVPQPTRQWRRADRPGNRLGSGASTAGGVSCASGQLFATG